MKPLISACLLIPLAACVAPEAPPAPRVAVAPPPQVTTSSTGAVFEDAPRPNYKMSGPTGESPIRVAR